MLKKQPFDYKKSLPFFLIIICFKLTVCEIFPTPENLKDNVVFWKKIYTEISLKEGLLHDREHPLIILKKISIKGMTRRQKGRLIKKEKARLQALFKEITTQPESSWSSQAKTIYLMYKKHGLEGNLEDAGERLRFQQGQKERYARGLYRSGAYIDTIRAIFARYNIPERLCYLPHVESSFYPNAYSKVGAAGLWQFMRGTGRLYMTINYSIDERRDPILSTYAAAKLLTHNYNTLQSWPLAITAYNHGLNGMKRAVAQTGSKDIGVIIKRHKGRLFKFASKNFYSCFLAASEIAKNPKKYFPDATFASPLKYQDIILQYYMRPSILAKHIGISKKELEELNLAIRPVVFRQNKLIPKGTKIHIPLSVSLSTAELALSNLPDSLKIKKPPRPKYYRVRRGDNLYSIARRLRVSAKGLALENNISRMNRIYAGQVLRIPGTVSSGKTIARKTVAEPEPERIIAAKKDTAAMVVASVKKVKPEIKPEPTPGVKTEPKQKEEEIPDTLKEIIMAYADVSTPPNVLSKAGNSYQFDASIYNLDVAVVPEEDFATIRISINETIGHYADWLGIPTQQIRSVNYMGRRSTIRINQELTIPVDKEAIDQFTRRRLEYHMALEEDFYNQYKVTELKSKVIERGENLWQICKIDNEIPLWLLKKYNRHINLAQLFPQMQLWLPVIEEKTENDLKQESDSEWRGIYPAYREPHLQKNISQIIP
jgi:membrane-bound lytic murein transglycosylase D